MLSSVAAGACVCAVVMIYERLLGRRVGRVGLDATLRSRAFRDAVDVTIAVIRGRDNGAEIRSDALQIVRNNNTMNVTIAQEPYFKG